MSGDRSTCFIGATVWPGGDAGFMAGGLLVKGTRIVSVLTPAEADAAALGADEVIDAAGMILMPPLADCHVHSSSTLFRGTENSLPLELWSFHAINHGRGFTDEAARLSVLLTAVELIRNGIGSYVDHFPQAGRAAIGLDAHLESGLRVAFAPFFADLRDEELLGIPLDTELAARLLPLAPRRAEEIEALYRGLAVRLRQQGHGRVELMCGPNAPQRCSDDFWKLWQRLQDSLGLGSHTHLLETYPQRQLADARWRGGLVRALDAAGLLHDRLSVAHGVWLSREEKELLARRGVTLSFNPVSNAMLGSGRKTIREDLELGLEVALGTDCSNAGGRHDLFEVMRHMLVSGRDPGSDFRHWPKPGQVLYAATTAGAGVFRNQAVRGRLETGAVADVLMLDPRAPGLAVAPVSPASIVAHADARSVHSLMVDGNWLLRNGTVTVLDEVALIERASVVAAELRALAAETGPAIDGLQAGYAAWQGSAFQGVTCSCCAPRLSPRSMTLA